MSQMTLTVSRESAVSVIANIVREGLTFEAREDGENVVITFTGGY